MDSERFDRLIRVFGQPRSRRQTLRGLAGAAVGTLVLGAREAAAGSRLGGAVCNKPTQCASGTCLTSGKCSCSASVGCTKPANRCKHATCTAGRCVSANTAKGTACPDDGNPCTKNLCDGSGHCTHPAKANGITCGAGQSCQEGSCETDNPETRTVAFSFGSPDMDPTACYVKVYVTGFTPGPHAGTLDSNAGQVAITVEVGADGTGDWKSASPIVQVGEGVTATVDGLASAKTLVTC